MSKIHDYIEDQAWATQNDIGLNQRANRIVSIRMGAPSSMSSNDDGYVSLRIEDHVSGEVLCDVEIPAGRFFRLMQGGNQHWPAMVTTHPERLGKHLRIKSVSLGREPYAAGQTDDERREWAENRAIECEEFQTCDAYTVSQQNTGWSATFRRWTDEPGDY